MEVRGDLIHMHEAWRLYLRDGPYLVVRVAVPKAWTRYASFNATVKHVSTVQLSASSWC